MKTEIKQDGWSNLLTGLGTKGDSTEHTNFVADKIYTRNELSSLYRFDGFAKKIVDIPADEMTREWIEIDGDPDGKIIDIMREMKFKKSLNTLRKWARLYGGALMVLLIDDGGELDQPLNLNRVKNILGCRVFDRWQVYWTEAFLTRNPMDKNYGYPDIYQVTPYSGGAPFTVHYSRVIRMDGEDLPEHERFRNNGWGDSVFQSIYRKIRQFSQTEGYISAIIKDFQQMTVTIDGLQEMIASGQEDLVKKRIEIMNISRSILNAVILDKEEQFQKVSSSVAGLSDIMDRFAISMSGVTNIPATKLFGQSPAGLNSTGQSDLINYYNWIRSEQDDHFREPIERIMQLAAPLAGLEYDNLTLNFKDLYVLTEAEQADAHLKQAQIDNLYLMNGTLSQEEIRQSRFGGHRYSYQTELLDGPNEFGDLDVQTLTDDL